MKHYTVSRAMRILDVSRPTIMKWIEDGKLAGATKGEGPTDPWLIPGDEVERVRQERVAELEVMLQEIQEQLSHISTAKVEFD